MFDILKNLLFSTCLSSIYIFIWCDLLNKKCNFKRKKTYLIFFLIILVLYNINKFDILIRVFLLIVLFVPMVRMLFNVESNAC